MDEIMNVAFTLTYNGEADKRTARTLYSILKKFEEKQCVSVWEVKKLINLEYPGYWHPNRKLEKKDQILLDIPGKGFTYVNQLQQDTYERCFGWDSGFNDMFCIYKISFKDCPFEMEAAKIIQYPHRLEKAYRSSFTIW